MAAQDSKPENQAEPRGQGDVLDIRDVLSAIPLGGADADSVGASLIFRTVGDSTVVSVDPDGTGPIVALQIATLEGVSGMTLQQLLSNNVDIAC